MGHATRCKYCGFISKYGGIARLKAHLGGVDLKTQLESCPNVPPEVKSLMAKEVKRYMKKSKGIPMVLQGKTLARVSYLFALLTSTSVNIMLCQTKPIMPVFGIFS